MTSSGTCWHSSRINGTTLQQLRYNMTKYQKIWYKEGYDNNQQGEHPEAICQERWSDFVIDCDWADTTFTFLVEHFPFYKQGATKAYNEKNK